MGRVAQKLGPALGHQVTFVSISIDPEHEGPPQLLTYAKALDADRAGWLFLSGSSDQIDAVLAAFGVSRERTPSGEIEHLGGSDSGRCGRARIQGVQGPCCIPTRYSPTCNKRRTGNGPARYGRRNQLPAAFTAAVYAGSRWAEAYGGIDRSRSRLPEIRQRTSSAEVADPRSARF